MNYHKILLIVIGFVFALPALPVSNNAHAILYYRLDLFESANKLLQQKLLSSGATNDDKAEACFYLGNIALKTQKADSAGYYFSKAKEFEPGSPYAFIGDGILVLSKDKKQAEAYFDEALSGKNKKDPFIAIVVARAYFDNNTNDYQEMVSEMKDKYDKLPDIYILEGDIMCHQQKYGEASSLYEQAIYFDPKCEEAYLKYARVYENLNPDLALDMLQKLLAISPNSEIAYLQMADIAFNKGDFTMAADNYNKYLSTGIESSPHDITRYTTILFYNKEYDKAMKYIDEGLAADPNNMVMHRLKMYINGNRNELNTEQAEAFMKKFPESEYIPLDYIFYGRMLKESKNYAQACSQFETALKMDPSKTEIYKDLAETYELTNDYKQAIESYRQFFSGNSQEAAPSDYLAYGQVYYFAANALKGTPDSVYQKTYLTKADSLFTIVTDKSPNNCLGYFWRARALSFIDYETTQGLAKPFYEKVLTILEPEGKDKKKIIECYSYLGFYYYVATDYQNSLTYWNKALVIDPENEVAKRAIAGINEQMKKK
ncbi:MAG: tetratricopeptide repeat protein [Bacteroidales bacterium]